MKTTTPATKILNKIYRQHLIKLARGQSYASNPGGSTPNSINSNLGPAAGGAVGRGGVKSSPAKVPGWVNTVGGGLNRAGTAVGNAFGGAGTALWGAANATAALPGAIAQLSPQPDVRSVGQDWLRQGAAGASDISTGLLNMFGQQEPSRLAEHQQYMQQKYFSNPKDKDLLLGWQGANYAGEQAARAIPAVATGQAALGAAAKVPQLAAAGNAVKTTIEGNKVLDPLMRGATVATGMPLHPGALSGWTGGATFASQMGQYALARKDPASSRLPAVAVDNAMRQVHPDAPEYIDMIAMPGVGKGTAALKAVADLSQPAQNDAVQQQQQQLAQEADAASFLDYSGSTLQGAVDQGVAAAYNNKIEELQSSGAPPEQLNAAFDEYLVEATKAQNLTQDEYASLKGEVDSFRQQLGLLPEDERKTMAAAVQNPTGPEAEALISKGAEEAGNKAVNSAMNNPEVPKPKEPQEFGAWAQQTFNTAAESFQQMDPMSQIATVFGLGAGALGILGALGGGGMGSFLLGALGLGAAGFMGANAGMFGQDAQNFAKDTMFNIGAATGIIPQVQRDELTPLLQSDPMAALSKQAPKIDYAAAAMNPAGYAKTIGPQIQQAEAQLSKLQQMVGLRPDQLMQITPGLSAEDAQLAINNAKAVLADAQNPQGKFGAQLALAREFLADPEGVRNREMQKHLGSFGSSAGQFVADSVIPGGSALMNMASQGIQDGMGYVSGLFKGSSDMNIAQRIIMEELTMKAARCWAGYEPVPGKKPYSDGSCRPVGSKKKKKAKKK